MLTVERILRLMKEREITAVKLAADLGVSKSTISEWKSGRATPNKHISKLADVLETSADYLLGKTDNPALLSAPLNEDDLTPEERTKLDEYKKFLIQQRKV